MKKYSTLSLVFGKISIFFVAFLMLLILRPLVDLRANVPTRSAVADTSTRSADILRQFTAKMKSISAFELKFSMVLDGSYFEGVVQSQGQSFKFTNSQLELYCDGTTKWVYNIDNKELIILPNDSSQTDLTENPLAFLTSLEKGYSYNDKARTGSVGDKSLWFIELKPLNKKLAYTSITLGIEKGTLRPVSVEYLSKDGTKHIAKITSFLEKSPWPATNFTFPTTRMSGLTVTDLR